MAVSRAHALPATQHYLCGVLNVQRSIKYIIISHDEKVILMLILYT